MSKADFTAQNRPNKPYPEFPLFPHASGRWAKKIRGKFHYFGKWDDPDAALEKYNANKDALHSGLTPRPDTSELRVKDCANAYLEHKQALRDEGGISVHTMENYKLAATTLVEGMGKGRLVADLRPDDFAKLRKSMATKWGPHRLAVNIQHIRSIFKHAYEAGLLDRPMRFGPGFARPTKKAFRLHRAAKGAKDFTREEILDMVNGALVPGKEGPRLIAASVPMRAMILLGVNGGLSNSDCGRLTIAAIDLDRGWLDFPRAKTGVARRVPLWPETVDAIRAALDERPEPKNVEDAALVFITKYGLPWAKDTPDNPVTKEMAKLLKPLGIKGRNFYALRHTLETVGGETRDQVAVDAIMGHDRGDMASVYRERISDERLRAVADHVRHWLFG